MGYKIADAAAGAFSSMRARARGASGHSASGADAGGGSDEAGSPDPACAGRAASVNAGREGAGTAGGARATPQRSGAAETAGGEKGRGRGGANGPREKKEEEEDWDGSVGPQVVKAFTNYFSKEVGVGEREICVWGACRSFAQTQLKPSWKGALRMKVQRIKNALMKLQMLETLGARGVTVDFAARE